MAMLKWSIIQQLFFLGVIILESCDRGTYEPRSSLLLLLYNLSNPLLLGHATTNDLMRPPLCYARSTVLVAPRTFFISP